MKNFSRSQKRDSIIEQQTRNISTEEAIKILRLLHFFSNNRIIPVKKKQEKLVAVHEA